MIAASAETGIASGTQSGSRATGARVRLPLMPSMTSPRAGATMDSGTVSEENRPSIPGTPSFPYVLAASIVPTSRGT